jgi:hypothetical protein
MSQQRRADLSPRITLINFQRPHGFADLFEGAVDGISLDVRMLRVEIRVGRRRRCRNRGAGCWRCWRAGGWPSEHVSSAATSER